MSDGQGVITREQHVRRDNELLVSDNELLMSDNELLMSNNEQLMSDDEQAATPVICSLASC